MRKLFLSLLALLLFPVAGYALDVNNPIGIPFLTGVTDASSAAAGKLGEYTSNTLGGSQTPPATGAYVALATMTLTAGDWDIYATGSLSAGGTTVATDLGFAISTSNTSRDATNVNNRCAFGFTLVVSVDSACSMGPRRVTISSSTTYYLVGQLTYSTLGGATFTTDSTIMARRVR